MTYHHEPHHQPLNHDLVVEEHQLHTAACA